MSPPRSQGSSTESTPGGTRGSPASTQSPSISPGCKAIRSGKSHGMAFSSPNAPYTQLFSFQSIQSPSSAQVLNSRNRILRIFGWMPKNAYFSPLVTGPSAQVWLGPYSNLSLAYKPQANNHRRVPFLGEFYSFIDPIFTGVQGVRLCSTQRQLPCLPPNRPLPITLYR